MLLKNKKKKTRRHTLILTIINTLVHTHCVVTCPVIKNELCPSVGSVHTRSIQKKDNDNRSV